MDDYGNLTDSHKFGISLDIAKTVENYNAIFGNDIIHRISGRIVKAMKARVSLLAASPAFSDGDVTLWARAADDAAVVLDKIGGISGLDPNGHRFYLPAFVDAIDMSKGMDQKEVLWRSAIGVSLSLESKCFPPSLFGEGDVNPSQNLVDAFPAGNGYPISDPASLYDASDPYAGRDPRLSLYVLHNGSSLKGKVINTGVGGGINAKDSIMQSTRTGYYCVNFKGRCQPGSYFTGIEEPLQHYMRYTELFLIYAEAANEAWGLTERETMLILQEMS